MTEVQETSASVVVRVRRRRRVIQKILRVQRRVDRLKLQRRLSEVDAIGKVIRRRIRVAERGQTEGGLNELQYAPEIMLRVRNVLRLDVRRDHNQRYSETIHISASPGCAIHQHLRWRDVVVPASPVV